jgi:hypothetical protein
MGGKPFSVAKNYACMDVPRTTVIRRVNQAATLGSDRSPGSSPLHTREGAQFPYRLLSKATQELNLPNDSALARRNSNIIFAKNKTLTESQKATKGGPLFGNVDGSSWGHGYGHTCMAFTRSAMRRSARRSLRRSRPRLHLFWVWVVILVGVFGSPFWALALVVVGVFIALVAIGARAAG